MVTLLLSISINFMVSDYIGDTKYIKYEKAYKYEDIEYPSQFQLKSLSNIMSSHLLLLITFLVTFNSSNTAFLRAPFLGIPGSGDIIQLTRTQANSLKTTLRSLTSKPEASPILKKVFSGQNGCLQNMYQVTQAIETSTQLFENAGAEIKQLVQTVQHLQKISDTPKAVRETAKIIRLLDVIIPKIPPSSSVCTSDSSDVFE